MIEPRVILGSKKFHLTLERLCHQLIENNGDFRDTCLVGVQPRGPALADRINGKLIELLGNQTWEYGLIDPTFYRDDFRRRTDPIRANETRIDFFMEGRKVVLIDDVFFTGRTIRAAMDAVMHYGRPSQLELLVLIDRRLSRQLPIQPDYVGKRVDAISSERVRVVWDDDSEQDHKIWIEADQ
jgi:pyrimidine operon attenuation protein/uracil phosphoribosyltransferase